MWKLISVIHRNIPIRTLIKAGRLKIKMTTLLEVNM